MNKLLVLLMLAVMCGAQEKPKPSPYCCDDIDGKPDFGSRLNIGGNFPIVPTRFIIKDINASEILVSISMNGEVKFGAHYKPDAAAEEFWRYMAKKSPSLLEQRISKLEKENKELKHAAPTSEIRWIWDPKNHDSILIKPGECLEIRRSGTEGYSAQKCKP